MQNINQNQDKSTPSRSLLSQQLFLFMTLIPHSVPLYRLFSSLYLTMQPFAQGDSIFSSGKKKCTRLIYRHHIIKLSRSIFCRLNLSYICVLIIDSLLYHRQNATKITEHCSMDGMKPSLRFDRLSHLITTLKH